MRDCPGCGNPYAYKVAYEYNKASVEKSGGKAPSLSLFACDNCGMRYVDQTFSNREINQSWFDHYYLTYYKTDDAPYSAARLENLAACVHSYWPEKVLDIGGMDGELAQRIKSKKIIEHTEIRVHPVGVGDKANDKYYNAAVLSHTLEHIYDVPAMFERIKAALVPGGLLFVEVPIWMTYDDLTYDNHWQHVNKFRPIDLWRIVSKAGFEIIEHKQIEDYREYHCWRIIGRLA